MPGKCSIWDRISPLEFKTDSRQVILPFSITSHPFSPLPVHLPFYRLIFRVTDTLFRPTRFLSSRPRSVILSAYDPVAAIAFQRYGRGFSIGVIRTFLPQRTFFLLLFLLLRELRVHLSFSANSSPWLNLSASRRVFLTHCQPRVMDGGISCDRLLAWGRSLCFMNSNAIPSLPLGMHLICRDARLILQTIREDKCSTVAL